MCGDHSCYDENAETIDSYVSRIKQVAALLNYGEPQILELFKNTLPSKLYWILFSINNLRDAVDAAKRVLTKEKIDKQLSGQSGTATPFMKVGDVPHSSKKVSFNAHNPIREQLESLTSMSIQHVHTKEENNRPFKPQIYPKRGRGQNRQNFGNRERNRSFSRDRQRQNFRANYRGQLQNRCIQYVNKTVGKKVTDVRIIVIIEMTVEIEKDKTLGETSVMTVGIEVDQEKEV